jgi:hypothetical protein
VDVKTYSDRSLSNSWYILISDPDPEPPISEGRTWIRFNMDLFRQHCLNNIHGIITLSFNPHLCTPSENRKRSEADTQEQRTARTPKSPLGCGLRWICLDTTAYYPRAKVENTRVVVKNTEHTLYACLLSISSRVPYKVQLRDRDARVDLAISVTGTYGLICLVRRGSASAKIISETVLWTLWVPVLDKKMFLVA